MPQIPLGNSSAQLLNAVLILRDLAQDILGLKTFKRAPGPPFAVESGSGKVEHLEADLLDGQHGDFYQSASNLNAGTLPDDVFPDTLPNISGENIINLNAGHFVSGTVPAAQLAGATLNATQLLDGFMPAARGIRWDPSTINGTVNNFSPGDMDTPLVVVRRAHASDVEVTGILAGVPGQCMLFINVGAGVMYFQHASGASAVGNQLVNVVTSGRTPVAAGGFALYVYDSLGVWRLASHEQGEWITPTHADANYVGTGGWTVTSGDIGVMKYRLSGKTLRVQFAISATTVVAGTALHILNGAWGGYTIKTAGNDIVGENNNAGGNGIAIAAMALSDTKIQFLRQAGANWSAATNATSVYGKVEMEVV